MLTMNYRYRVYPNTAQEQLLKEWMDTCRVAYNYGLREIKDWCNSRKCMVDRCSISHEYIMPADSPFPGEVKQLNALPSAKKVFPRLGEAPSQVLQQALKQLHARMGGISKNWAGLPSIQEVWAIQIFVVSPICQESCDWDTYCPPQTGADTN